MMQHVAGMSACVRYAARTRIISQIARIDERTEERRRWTSSVSRTSSWPGRRPATTSLATSSWRPA